MHIRRSRVALFTATLLITLGLSACGEDESQAGQNAATTSQSSTTSTDSPTTAGNSEPAAAPTAEVEPAPVPVAVIGAAELQWVAPQENTDGSVLQNLAGFTILYGKSATDLDQSIRIDNPSIDRYIVEQLPAGTYYFGVKAHNSKGAESALSNLVTKVIG